MSLKMTGNVAYHCEGKKIHIGICKITNNKGHKSGTLKVQLITSDRKIEDGSALFTFQYDVVASFELQPLSGGYHYDKIERCVDKLHEKNRTYTMLTLSEYSNDKFQLRDYRVFQGS